MRLLATISFFISLLTIIYNQNYRLPVRMFYFLIKDVL